MLRRVVELDPCLRPSADTKVLTKLQKDILAAEFAAEQDNFCEAEEYKTRLDATLERLVFCN